jgi:signal transduction histidine kinase/ActR/RegA family two-component response regulator
MAVIAFDEYTSRVVDERAEELFTSDLNRQLVRTDRLFGGLLMFQWLGAVLAACFISPRTWSGDVSTINPHVWAALILGGLITILPVLLVVLRPGAVATRHVIGVSQMLMGALLIHLTGGRIETHFHVFGSLAFLAFYRDWRVLITASAVVAVDHLLRGIYWPESVFGVVIANQFHQWRWLEHAGWVIFEDIFLTASCLQGIREMKAVALRHAQLEATNGLIEQKVQERTEELAQHRVMLEATVKERTHELEDAMDHLQRTNVQLQEANTHRSRFLSMMSHELRTPLNAILGFADLLASEGFGPLNGKQKDYVTRIDTSGGHLLSLINDVLDLAKIDIGAMELSCTQIAADELIRSTVQMMSTQFHTKGLQAVIEIEPGLQTIYADERKYKQVLLNLLSNAVKYSPQGRQIIIRAWNSDGMTYTSVTDYGVGIESSQLEKIFEEFHQADRQRDEALGGIGLGLALTKRIVTLHKGRIGVESEVGMGSVFWFSIPVDPAGAPALAIIPADETPAGPRSVQKLILVAEDNEMNLEMIMNMLALRKHEVLIARNGQECVDIATARKPDLILTDIRMPVMDGLVSTRTLREIPAFKDVPIIALTANASAVSEKSCLDAGCTEHITKPVKSDKLFAILDKYLLKKDESKAQAV